MSASSPISHYPDGVSIEMALPFVDKTCGQIVRELEKRNWRVPGVTCEFRIGSGESRKHRVPFIIEGDNFKLHFMQGRDSLCAISQIVVPRFDFRFEKNLESGRPDDMRLFVYAGSQWPEDKAHFISPAYNEPDKFHSKQQGQQRWYLCYTGHFASSGCYSQYLYHDDAWGCEYGLEPNDPIRHETEKVLEKLDQLLKTEVLQVILDQPLPEQQVDIFYEEPIAFPESVGPLYCFGNQADATRITWGRRAGSDALAPTDRYGFPGSDALRVVGDDDGPLSTRLALGITQYRLYGIGAVTSTSSPEEIAIAGHDGRSSEGRFVFRVVPNRSNGVYVVDRAPSIEKSANIPGRIIVPISKYTGGFEQPVIVIGRELDLDEVELVSGPWPSCNLAIFICQHSENEKANQLFQTAVELYEHKEGSQACTAYSDAIIALVAICQGNEQLAELGLQSICSVRDVVGDMVVARSLGLF